MKGTCVFFHPHYGSYSNYSICSVNKFFPIKFPIIQNPFFVNPITAVGMMYYINKLDSKGFG